MNTRVIRRVAVGLLSAAVFAGSSPAFAAEWSQTWHDSGGWTEATKTIVNSRDLAADGNPGTVESGQYSYIFRAQTCEERDLAPDYCSGFESTDE
ncbi:hypothetical protein ACFQLX_04110 [Streptomyces polyrhachis]|uniref:Secreted protein n=1 Tax=Streptomyces polyrhachis TaxID=1282885 RepID=A0ABW2G9C7_9ACTN